MPLRWTIDHSRKFVHIVVADGPLALADLEEHFDATADAMGYAKLFGATRFEPVYSDSDVMAMGARLSRLHRHPGERPARDRRRTRPWKSRSGASPMSRRRSARPRSSGRKPEPAPGSPKRPPPA
jgi:hypothetical protein